MRSGSSWSGRGTPNQSLHQTAATIRSDVNGDADYGERFSSTPGYSFIRSKKKDPALQAQYEFPQTGTFRIACKVQDDMGGEGIWTGQIDVK